MPTKKDDAATGNGAPVPAPVPLVPTPVFLVPAPVENVSSGGTAKKHDETIPGGAFFVNGKLVNSENQRIHEDGKLLSPDELAAEV